VAEKDTVLSSFKRDTKTIILIFIIFFNLIVPSGGGGGGYLLSSSQPDSNEANTALPMLKSVSNSNVNAPNTDMTKKEALLLPVFL